MSKSVLIMSSTSEIASALAKLYLSSNTTLLLHGRSEDKLNKLFSDLKSEYPSANIVKLPLMDLVSPVSENLPDHEYASLLDRHYSSWFDSLVQKHGLPQTMVISAGGTSHGKYNPSTILELNAVSAMKCCEQFIKKVRQHIHNEKYKHKQFNILFMSSVAGENKDTMESLEGLSHYIYGLSKNVMNNYLAKLRQDIGKLNIRICNAKISFTNTNMLRAGMEARAKSMGSQGFRATIKLAFTNWFVNQVIIEPEQAAVELKHGLESGEDTFYVPGSAQYLAFFSTAGKSIFNFFINGIIFSLFFVPSVRTWTFGWIFKYINSVL